MSLDVTLQGDPQEQQCRCGECGNQHTRTVAGELFTRNITHNLARMAEEAGLYDYLWRPEEVDVERAAQLVEPLVAGIERLRGDPARFRALNPANRWGNYEGLVVFVEDYLRACVAYPDAHVRVSR